MAVTAADLRTLHRIHRQLSDLNERLERGPRQIRARKIGVANLQEEQAKAAEAAKTARMNADRKQLDLKSGEGKILDLKGKLNACSTNKEYQALLEQIAAAEMANSVLSDEILETWESIEELDVKVAEAKSKVATSEEELAKLEAKVAAETEGIETDIARLQVELTEAEEQLPGDFKVEYDRVVRAKGDDAMTAADGEACGGCYQRLTPNLQNELTLGRPLFCPACGRLLYLPE